jgi:PAS domain S-box-containing protein
VGDEAPEEAHVPETREIGRTKGPPAVPTGDALSIYAALLRDELGDEALRASQHMLEMLTETIPQAIWWKDRNCVFLGVNRVLADMAHLDPEDMIGKSDRDMPWADDAPYGAEWFQRCDREVMEAGEAIYGIQEELLKADGSKVWIETSKVPLRDFDGNVIGVLGTFEDITERRRAEEARQRTLADLDERVRTRTSALRRANERLRREVEERVRLEAKERQQRAYAEALRDTAAAVAQSLDLDEVLDQVLLGVERLMAHHLAAVILIEDDGTHTLAHCRRAPRHPVEGEICTIGAPVDDVAVVGRLRAGAGPLILNDVRSGAIGTTSRSVLGEPIEVSDTRIGYLVVENESPGFFTDGHSERLTALADLAAAAISNAQLFSAEAELAALEERQRLARELHDAVSQTLWTASLVADSMTTFGPANVTAEQVDRLLTLTRGALAEMRTLLLELRPAALAETPFVELIDQLGDALRSRKAIKVRVDAPPAPDLPELPPAEKHAFYRIAQESLHNVGRHAFASEVVVAVSIVDNEFSMLISDDGEGFAVGNPKADRLGLTIMQERAHAVGARFTVSSTPGVGTEVAVRLPVGAS